MGFFSVAVINPLLERIKDLMTLCTRRSGYLLIGEVK